MGTLHDLKVDEEITGNSELTKAQLERQDEVDNAIFRLLKDVIPKELQKPIRGSALQLHWDIEEIGQVRDVVQKIALQHYVAAEDFYPETRK